MDDRELAVSFNVVLNEEIQNQLRRIQKKLSEKIKEKRFYDNSPHLAICTKFMPRITTNKYIPIINKQFKDIKAFDIEFTKFEPSPTGNYIFLNLSKNTRDHISKLNEEVKRISKGIGNESPKGLPPKYPYDPHISIIKLESYQIQEALNMLNDEFKVSSMKVDELELTVEKRDETGFASFPQELVLKLR